MQINEDAGEVEMVRAENVQFSKLADIAEGDERKNKKGAAAETDPVLGKLCVKCKNCDGYKPNPFNPKLCGDCSHPKASHTGNKLDA